MTGPLSIHPFLRELGYITLARDGDTDVMRLVGDIDTDAVVAFEQSGVADGRTVGVLDLTEVTFLSSSGIALLLRQTQPARDAGHLPQLRGLTPSVRRILQLTGTLDFFDVAG